MTQNKNQGCGKEIGYRHESGAKAYCGDDVGTHIIYCEKCKEQQNKPLWSQNIAGRTPINWEEQQNQTQNKQTRRTIGSEEPNSSLRNDNSGTGINFAPQGLDVLMGKLRETIRIDLKTAEFEKFIDEIFNLGYSQAKKEAEDKFEKILDDLAKDNTIINSTQAKYIKEKLKWE